MGAANATNRVRMLDGVRRGLAGTIHAGRQLAIPNLRGQKDHTTLISSATYSPWNVDAEFLAVRGLIRDSTLLDEMRLYELWQLVDQVGHLQGDAIEVGCWRGGSGCLIAKRISQRQPDAKVFLCDTFAGVVKAGDRDAAYRGGEHSDSDPATVRRLAQRVGASQVRVLRGIFPEETGDSVADRVFKFAHIDVDVYQGSRDTFDWLRPRLLVGSVVVFDDYGSSQTSGVRAFVDELHDPDFVVVRNMNGQAEAIRRAATGPAPNEKDAD